MLQKRLTILRIITASIIGLLLLLYLFIQLPWVQNKLVQKATTLLAENLGTVVKVGHVNLSLFNSIDLENILIKDQQNDTLLYAQALKLRASDLLFSRHDPIIKYIGFEKAKVYLHRKSPIWNYDFIVRYFNTDTTKSKTHFDFKKLDFSHIEFISDDEWAGEKMEFRADNVIANLNKYTAQNIELDQVVINKPFYLVQSKLGMAKNLLPTDQKKQIKGENYFNPNHVKITANQVKIVQGKLWIENGFNTPTPQFDGFHIRMHDLNANISHFELKEDTIRAKVNLTLKERSGLYIQQLSTQFKMTPRLMEFNKLYAKTNQSIIGPYFAMEYTNLAKDFANFNHAVKMKAHFMNAQVATDDIAFFAPEVSTIHQKINTSFEFSGPVDNFKATRLYATYNNSFVKGDFSMQGIPDMRNTQINFNNVLAKTNYIDLLKWIPSLGLIKDLQVAKLNNLLFRGEFNGTLYDFVSKANISSPLGNAETILRLQFPIKGEPIYDGKINLNHFDIGALLNVKEAGWVNFNGSIVGTSFLAEKAKANIEGKIDSIIFNQYIYKNITTKGQLLKKAFNGSFKIKDPNLSLISNIEIDANNKSLKFNAIGDLLNVNFKPLHFTNNNIQLTGALDFNFEGNKIDDFIGYGKMFNGKLKGDVASINFDSLSIQSSIDKGKKTIKIGNDAIQASITGKFDINHLPASIQYFMQVYLPTYIPAPTKTFANQQFEVAIKTNYFEPYIRIFDKSFSGFNNINFTGAINTINKTLSAKANIPFAGWNQYAIKNGLINSVGTKDSLHLYFNAQSVSLSDSISFQQPALIVHTSNDVSKVSLQASSNSVLQQMTLNGTVNTYDNGIAIKWAPSHFMLNQKKWDIENGGELSIRKNNTYAKGFKFSQGLQEILLSSNKDDKNGLKLELKNIIMGDLTKMLFSYPNLEGLANGTIQLNDLLDNFKFSSALTIENFSFNNEPIGLTYLNAGFNKATGIVPFNFKMPNAAYNLAAEGTYNIKDSTNPLDATLFMYHSKFSLVEQFIGGILHELEGTADGQLHFGGRIENPYLLGSATLQNASMVVDYTKVKYFIDDNTTIRFTNEALDFGTVQLKDSMGRTAQFKGKILQQGFKHLVYDMEMSSPKIELLNMTAADNIYFYGNAVGKASMTIKGPEENIKMTINSDINDSSHIILPNTVSKESGKTEYIVFKKYGKSAVKSADIPTYNLVVDLDITANNKTKIDLIFDELSGDVIKAVGNGRIKIRVGNIEPLTIRGKYNIESGKYDFNFQSFIKKPFELIPEAGNFIEWTGDPLNADIHIDARYTAERVSLNDLVGTANFSNAVKTYRGNVYVIAALRNKLSRPSIKFSLAFPQGNPINTDNEFSQFISRLERDDNEILKQVSFLIVFNSFAPVSFSNTNISNSYSVTTIGINTISQLLAKEVNKSITGLISKLTGDKSIRFDIGSSVYNSGNLLDPTGTGIAINANKIDRQRVNLKLGRSFLNDKIIVNFGGDLDFNIRNSTSIQNGNFQWLPDLNIEFILTRNRKLRAIIFNRNSLDINGGSLGKRNRQGVSISYRKDFDDFADFFY